MKINPGRISGPVVVLIAVFALGMGVSSCAKPEPIRIVPPAPTVMPAPTQTPTAIQVYITGRVIAPDVYTLEPGSRIKQLVEAAGGFAEGADKAGVNLARQLVDEAHVHIPAVGEEPSESPPVFSDPTSPQRSGEIPLKPSDGLVNINLALIEELETLPGIGPITAQKILDYRKGNGSFSHIEGVMEVPGIGEGKFEQIKALITVGN